jgi:hypothetical protein
MFYWSASQRILLAACVAAALGVLCLWGIS